MLRIYGLLFLILFLFLSVHCVDIETNAGWTLLDIVHKSHLSLEYSFNQKYFWKTSSENNVQIDVYLTWLEELNGKLIHLDYSVLSNLCPLQSCSFCGGTGSKRNIDNKITNSNVADFSHHPHFPCPFCYGSGKIQKRTSCLLSPELELDIAVPAGSLPGQEFVYEPFSSEINGSMYGTIVVNVKGLDIPPSVGVMYNETKKEFVFPVNITALMGVQGFVHNIELGEGCLPLIINRSNKVTFSGMNISVPFSYLREYYCPSILFDERGEEGKTISLFPASYVAHNAPTRNLLMYFHVISIEEQEQAFLETWHCHSNKRRADSNDLHSMAPDPTIVGELKGQELAVSTNTMVQNELFDSGDGPEDEEEIICADDGVDHQLREKAFQQFRQDSFSYRKYWNWLAYLKEVTK